MNTKIQTILLSSIFSLLAGVAASVAPLSANAQPTHDCSDGCYIVTCAKNGNCSVWYCHGGTGCVQVGSFQQPMMQSENIGANTGQAAETRASSHQQVTRIAYATVCPNDKRCDLYRLTASKAKVVGSYDNINAAIKDQEAKDHKYNRE